VERIMIALKLWQTRINNQQGLKKKKAAGCQWLTAIILPTQAVEIRRIAVQSQPGQLVHETVS
jgi:hypothetical protein